MQEIMLTQGKTALVDDEDFGKLNQATWHAYLDGNRWSAQRSVWENKIGIKKSEQKCTKILMHRVVMDAPVGMQVDHINGNTLDNRKENLRICTNQQNTCNRKNANRNNKLGIKGVHWYKRNKKFIAQICINRKKINLGSYNVMGDADSAYRFAEEKYFGEFARNDNRERRLN